MGSIHVSTFYARLFAPAGPKHDTLVVVQGNGAGTVHI